MFEIYFIELEFFKALKSKILDVASLNMIYAFLIFYPLDRFQCNVFVDSAALSIFESAKNCFNNQYNSIQLLYYSYRLTFIIFI